MSNKRINKAFVRFDGSGRIVPSSLILQKSKPKVGDWHEIDAYECCNSIPTTTTTTTGGPTTTTTTTVAPTTTTTTTAIPTTTTTTTASGAVPSIELRISAPGTSYQIQLSNSVGSGTINWGDGTSSAYSNTGLQTFNHTYSAALTYTITITSGAPENITALIIASSTSADVLQLSNFASLSGLLSLVATDGDLTSVNLAGLTNLVLLNLLNNDLTEAGVDDILVILAGGSVSNGTVDLSGGTSSVPSATGYAAIATLQGRGWNVTVNGGVPTTTTTSTTAAPTTTTTTTTSASATLTVGVLATAPGETYAPILFNNNALSGTINWGDGNSEPLPSQTSATFLSHVYATVGSYTIQLVITNQAELTGVEFSGNTTLTIKPTSISGEGQFSNLDTIRLNDNAITGAFSLEAGVKDTLSELWLNFGGITSIDVTNFTVLDNFQIENNSLASINLTGTSILTDVRLENNLLDTSAVDSVLVHLENSPENGGSLTIGGTGNGVPSSTGLAAIANLEFRFWTISYNSSVTTTTTTTTAVPTTTTTTTQAASGTFTVGITSTLGGEEYGAVLFNNNALIGTVNWGDGNSEPLPSQTSATFFTHVYATAGNYTIQVAINNQVEVIGAQFSGNSGGTIKPTSLSGEGQFTNLNEIRLEDNAIVGAFSLSGVNDTLDTLWLTDYGTSQGAITSVDVTNYPLLTNLQIDNQSLTALDLTGTNTLNDTRLVSNNLNSAAIDAILAHFVSTSVNGGSLEIDGAGNGIPSSAGLADIAILEGRGWNIAYNGSPTTTTTTTTEAPTTTTTTTAVPVGANMLIDVSNAGELFTVQLRNDSGSGVINWGDGSTSAYGVTGGTQNFTHTYASTGTFTITLVTSTPAGISILIVPQPATTVVLGLSDFTLLTGLATLIVTDGFIQAVDLSGLAALTILRLDNNELTQSGVDNILVALAAESVINGTLNLSGGTSAIPSATGDAAIATLQSRGWSVTVNPIVTTTTTTTAAPITVLTNLASTQEAGVAIINNVSQVYGISFDTNGFQTGPDFFRILTLKLGNNSASTLSSINLEFGTDNVNWYGVQGTPLTTWTSGSVVDVEFDISLITQFSSPITGNIGTIYFRYITGQPITAWRECSGSSTLVFSLTGYVGVGVGTQFFHSLTAASQTGVPTTTTTTTAAPTTTTTTTEAPTTTTTTTIPPVNLDAAYATSLAGVCSAICQEVSVAGPDGFAVGKIVYTDGALTTPLTGYTHIAACAGVNITGNVYEIDSVTGQLTRSTPSVCPPASITVDTVDAITSSVSAGNTAAGVSFGIPSAGLINQGGSITTTINSTATFGSFVDYLVNTQAAFSANSVTITKNGSVIINRPGGQLGDATGRFSVANGDDVTITVTIPSGNLVQEGQIFGYITTE